MTIHVLCDGCIGVGPGVIYRETLSPCAEAVGLISPMDVLGWILSHKLLVLSLLLVAYAFARLWIPEPSRSLLVFLGSGGHTGEMLRILEQLESSDKFATINFAVSQGDNLSLKKLAASPSMMKFDITSSKIFEIPRGRKVGQSYLTSIISSIGSVIASTLIIARVRPAVVLSNGPATGLILLAVGYIWRVITSSNTRLVYVESFARVNELSLSGKLALRFADRVIVQWPQLKDKYPRAEYNGILV